MQYGSTVQTPSLEGDPEVKRLRSTHPDWAVYSPQWSFYLSAYEGGLSFTKPSNLFKHSRENQEDYNARIERIHNMNYCEPLVDFFTNFIFSESIDRNGGTNKDFYHGFTENVNRKGDGIDDFMREVSDDSQIFGMSYILVDAPRIDSVLTKADEKAMGISPYWVLIKPLEVIDWVVDEFDTFQYVKRKQTAVEMFKGVRSNIETYTEFYPDRFVISKVDVSDINKESVVSNETVPNALNMIPILVARYKRSKEVPYMGLSFLRDFSKNNREIMNLTSLLQEFLYRQAFNILAKESDSGQPENEQSEGEFGSANLINVPKGAEFPRYITPPADPAKFIQDERGRIKAEMFSRAAQDAVNELFNGEKSSGFSQAQSFSKTVPFISSRADMLERVENQLMGLTMKLLGKTWDGKIKYKDNYAITNLQDALTQFLILVKDLQVPSESFVRAEFARLIHEYDGKMPEDVLVKIHKEIDDFSFTTWAATQKDALVGKASTSPGDQQKPKGTGTMAEVAAEAKGPSTGATKKANGG
jgi:hypothetical protein